MKTKDQRREEIYAKVATGETSVDDAIDALRKAEGAGVVGGASVLLGRTNGAHAATSGVTHEAAPLHSGKEMETQAPLDVTRRIERALRRKIAALCAVSEAELDPRRSFLEIGLESKQLVSLTATLSEEIGAELLPTIFFECQNIAELAAHFAAHHAHAFEPLARESATVVDSATPPREHAPDVAAVHQAATTAATSDHEPIAIVGIAGVFPQARDVHEFWSHLERGADLITQVPDDRPYMRVVADHPFWGGYAPDVDKFDASFFGISKREAELMDPKQRMMIELVWKAVEDSGHRPSELRSTSTGLFLGVGGLEYGHFVYTDLETAEPYAVTGISTTILTNRISYLMDWHGPSEAVDTACSSSLVAMHRAIEGIRNGDCDQAIAGGVNLLLSPFLTLALGKAGMLSEDGRCKTFDRAANGYVRAEGGGALLLKRLSKALADGDHVYATILSSSVNHGGQSSSLTAPNPKAQEQLVVRAFERAGIDPQTVSYIEAHGTGTKLGDPVEIKGLVGAFRTLLAKRGIDEVAHPWCGLGSVKANTGHLEAASGMAGVVKVLLAMKHGRLPGLVHFQTLNDFIKLDGSPFFVQRGATEWVRAGEMPRRASVSSFGFGGVNAHVVLQESTSPGGDEAVDAVPFVITLSAKTRAALERQCAELITWLDRELPSDEVPGARRRLRDVAYTLQVGRDEMSQRLALITSSVADLRAKIRAFIEGSAGDDAGVLVGDVKSGARSALDVLRGAEGREFVSALLARGRLPQVASLWTGGLEVDWRVLYANGAPRRVSLPTYPFARDRYWKDARIGAPANSPLHRLVDRALPALPGESRRFTKTVSTTDVLVHDHRVSGRGVLPGVTYLEMARRSFVEVAGDARPFRITRVMFERPLVVDAPRELTIELGREGDRYTFSISSAGEDGPMLHAAGEYELEDLPASAEHVDLAAIRARCDAEVDPASLYAEYDRAGLLYGPFFRCLKRFATGDAEAVGWLELAPGDLGTLGDFTLHPALMDSALHVVLAHLFERRGGRGKTLLPFSIEAVEWLAPLTARTGVYVRTDDAGRIDVALLDADGRVAVKIHGLGAREAKGIDTGMLRAIYFEPIDLRPADAARAPEGRAIVVYADDAQDLERALRARLEGAHASIDSCSVADARRGVLASLVARASVASVYLVFGAGAAYPSLDALRESDSAEIHALFDVAKALETSGVFEARAELVVFTCGALKTSVADDIASPSLGGVAPFLKSLQFEYPDCAFRSIDLDAARPADSLRAPVLRDALHDADAPRDLAIRRGSALVQKSAPIEAIDGATTALREGGVYVIAGGAGGIGLELAAHLAKSAHAKVALVGRRSLDAATAERLRAMSVAGAEVAYFEGDVVDRAVMRRTLDAVRARFGAIHGVFHLAFVLADALFAKMTKDELVRSLRPKVQGSLVLADLLADEPLDFLSFFSSGIGIVGSGGQCNYAAGNGFQDALAAYLSPKRRYIVQAINWGYWGTVGAVASADYNRRLTKIGLESITPEIGFPTLTQALAFPLARVVAVKGSASVRAQLGDDGRATVTIQRDTERSTVGSAGERVAAHLRSRDTDVDGAIAEAVDAHVALRLAASADRKVLVVDLTEDGSATSERVADVLRAHGDRARHVRLVASAEKTLPSLRADVLVTNDITTLRSAHAVLRRGGVLVATTEIGGDDAGRVAESGFVAVRTFGASQRVIAIGESNGISVRKKRPRAAPAAASIRSTLPPPAPRVAAVAALPVVTRGAKTASSYVKRILAEALKEEASSFGDDAMFAEHGVDSLISLEIRRRFEKDLGKLPATLLFDYTTVRSLSTYFEGAKASELTHVIDGADVSLPPAKTGNAILFAPRAERPSAPSPAAAAETALAEPPGAPAPAPAPAPAHEPEATPDLMEIAIVGLSGRYPMSPTLDALADNLSAGRRCVSEVPPGRWGDGVTAAARWGGYLADVDKFDPLFFQIAPAEADEMDPQERILMELALHALEDAGYPRGELLRTNLRAGVFLGQMSCDYLTVGTEAVERGSPNLAASYFWSTPNRISYWFNLRGPSLAVGTACSSSLTSVHLAVQSLRSGECEVALAGGVNLILHPDHLRRLDDAKMLTRGDRTRSFGRDADGFVAGEGAGIVVLKPLHKALLDGDHVYAVMKGTAVAASGKTNGYLAPSLDAQSDVVVDALADAKLSATAISYVESAATGASLNDAIEVSALTRAFRKQTEASGFCAIGSVKSNVGHLESASGIAALTKVLLQLRTKEIFPSIDAEPTNAEIDFASSPFRLQTARAEWPKGKGPRRAGVSSFGAGGAIAHVIVEESEDARPRATSAADDGKVLVPLSARDDERLRAYAASLAEHLDRQRDSLRDDDLARVAFTLQSAREPLAERAAFVVATLAELRERLARFADDGSATTRTGHVARKGEGTLASLGADGDLDALAARWTEGGLVDWRSLYRGRPTRLPLPGYPFARRRCWIAQAGAPPKTSDATAPAPTENVNARVRGELAELLARTLGLAPSEVGADDDLGQYGLDSIRVTKFVSSIAERFALDLTPTLFFGHDTLAAIADTLVAKFAAALSERFGARATVALAPSADSETKTAGGDPIAIVGLSGRFPQSPDAETFWKNLRAGRDAISAVPTNRWDAVSLAAEDPALAWGGFMPDVDRFDAEHFGVSAHEACLMDPQHRVFLETVWTTFADAGYTPGDYAGRSVGVFVGVASQDYLSLLHDRKPLAHMATGNSQSVIPNRVSYMFDFRGPSEAIDTACSASLVAVHRAIAAIDRGECEIALAGGVNALLSPDFHLAFSDAGMLSRTGRCRTFDASADGYVRAEGVGAVLLKPLSKALADGDHVYGVIRGSAVNHGGRTASLTAPNPKAQHDVLVAAYDSAGIDPSTVGLIETHGTGTRLGDPIEIEALKSAFAELGRRHGRSGPAGRCALGAVKSNIGHLETAAGIAGLIKVLLALRDRVLPGNLHFSELNPYIRLDESPFYVASETHAWEAPIGADGRATPRRAGVSSFGFGGVNAHIVLEEFVPGATRASRTGPTTHFVPVSAPTAALLRDYVGQLRETLAEATGAKRASRLSVDEIVTLAARVLGVDASTLDSNEQLLHLGVDPVMLGRLVAEVNERCGTALAVTSFSGADRLVALIERARAAPPLAPSSAAFDEGDTLPSVAFTLQYGRLASKERVAFVAGSLAELIAKMDEFLRGASASGVHVGSVATSARATSRPGDARATSGTSNGVAYAVQSPDVLARRWVAGEPIDLHADGVTPRRIALPSAPLAPKRYWFDDLALEPAVKAEPARKRLVVCLGVSTQTVAGTTMEPPNDDGAAADVVARIKASLATVLGIVPSAIPDGADFKDLGLDSIMTIKLVKLLNKAFRAQLDPREIIANPTIEKVARLATRASAASTWAASER